MTAREVLSKIHELNDEYLISRMPIRLTTLQKELDISNEELITHLEELRLQGMLFHDNTYVLLSHKAAR